MAKTIIKMKNGKAAGPLGTIAEMLKASIDAILILRQLQKKHLIKNRKLNFFSLEKAFR